MRGSPDVRDGQRGERRVKGNAVAVTNHTAQAFVSVVRPRALNQFFARAMTLPVVSAGGLS